MAHDNEYRLVSKVIADRVIIPVIENGIRPEWILDEDLRRVYDFVLAHYSNYREVPTIIAVTDNFPNFRALRVEDTLDYLIDKMVEFRRNKLTRNGLEVVLDKMGSNNHEAALTEMSKTVTEVNAQGVIGTTHLDLTTDPDSRFRDYEGLQNQKLLGIPTGFKTIDEATAGLQGGQLITVIAPPKTGKSQITLKVAVNTHLAGYVPMFQSFEMNNREQAIRHDAMRANISANRLRRGKLKTNEEERYIKLLDELKAMKPFHMVDAVNGLTIDTLVAKAEQLKPDILFVDGVYLMLDQVTGEANTPQALTNITRGLKRVAQKLDIPVVITTQTLLWKMKGGKVSADSIGYSSSFFQDSDVILGLEQIEGDEEMRMLRIVQSRNSPPVDAPIVWKWDVGCFHEEADMGSCKYCSPWGTPSV
jgi:replicative DNA helicase